MTRENTYTITKPINAKYTKLLDYLKAHRGEEFSRVELFLKSGYWTKKDLARFHNEHFSKNGTESLNTAFRGQNCYVTGKMHELGIIRYNPKTKKWSCGDKIDTVRY